jgi:outer membrane lipoprotein SlyB
MIRVTTFIFLILTVSQAAFAQRADRFSSSQAMRGHEVMFGTIRDLRPVTIQGEAGLGGAVAGGVAGRSIGRTIGGGSGNRAARDLGTVAGVGAGRMIQQNLRTTQGVEITVTLENGRNVVVVQEQDNMFRVGDQVRVLTGSDGSMRVRL